MRLYSIIAIIIAVAITIIFYQNSKYVLEENKQVLIVQFGQVMKAQTAPGTYYKIPFIQKTHFYDYIIQTAEISHQVPTIDKKFLLLKIKAFWRISDPILYFKSVHSSNNAANRVEDITEMAGRMVIISHKLDEIINVTNITDPDNIQSKREIEIEIFEIAKAKLLEFGIGLTKLEGKISYPI